MPPAAGEVQVRGPRRGVSASIAIGSIALALLACGGSPSRFNPGPPAAPAGLAATPGNGQVFLTWSPADGASAYAIYFSTSPGVTKADGVKVASIASTSSIVLGLTNDKPYFFVVTSVNSSGESAESNEVSATPKEPITFAQTDLAGTWRFSVLDAGAWAGWKRGTMTIDGGGSVTFATGTGTDAYADSDGSVAPPVGFLPVLLIDPSGEVRDSSDASAATFTGILAPAHRNLIVATASTSGTQSIAILLKHDPNLQFVAGAGSGTDISGWGGGGTGGGPRKVVYDQISSGAFPQEWEFAAGQIGQTPSIQYASASGGTVPLPYLAPSGPPRPSNKNTSFAIDAAGVVTETVTGAAGQTQPVFLLTRGYMSDDKTLVVGVGLGPSDGPPPGFSASGRHALRVYHVTNVNSSPVAADPMTGSQFDLEGTWRFRSLSVGASALSASGTMAIDSAGTATFSSYDDSGGGGVPPGFALTMVPDSLDLAGVSQFWGTLGSSGDPSLHGKLSYRKDTFVMTRTEPSRACTFTIALKWSGS